ncbi:uncharacterized protein LOC111057039 [Nilaparvata lugens]|uniref:uncharacterized protein LOC111057039 n=1 Tax=Nilaparvata lugens TaxID=108931 RepID=UPI00193DEA8C|nr:uncharacterized protein LOC111057039 [Nilaparvata lugens]
MDKEIKIEKQENEFGECELATSNVKDESSSHNGSTSNQMARVKQENDSSQEPAPECSTACSPTDDDFSQQHYLIPGYNLIFIKEEEYVEQEAEGCSVESEPEMWPLNCSTSETANATEVGGLNAHSISPMEEYTEPSVAGKKIKLYSCADCSYKTPSITHWKRHMTKHTGKRISVVEVEKQESAFDDSLIGAARSDTATQQIKIEKQEDEFGECELATSNFKDESCLHNGSTSNQMARVKQENDSSQEPAPECSTACSPTDDDFSQQHYLIPGYNLIFIKEEEYG